MTTLTLEAPSRFVVAPKTKPAHAETVNLPSQAKSWKAPASSSLQEATAVKAGTGLKAWTEAADEELISAICDGSEAALEVLYERYHRYAYALAYRILRDPAAAEDTVQEAFLSIWRKAASYQNRHGSVHSWLQAIVHHRAIDRVRASAHRDQQWTPLQAENEQDPASEEPEVWEQAWRGEQQRLIRVVLEQIPPAQRMVIELAYFGGYTHAEIAERWNIPLGTVKGRMRLGLQKMRLGLQEYGLNSL